MAEACTLGWHIAPFRADRWLELWEPAAARMPAFGAKSWSPSRAIDDPLGFQQTSLWESRSDFEPYWYSKEIETARASAIGYYDLPLLPSWQTLGRCRVGAIDFLSYRAEAAYAGFEAPQFVGPQPPQRTSR